MKSIEKTGRSVEEALDMALRELGVGADEVVVEVLSEASRGFLGILGTKDAKVKVTVRKNRKELAKEFVAGVIERMGLDSAIEVLGSDQSVTFNIVGKNLGILIGRRGETLKALEFLTGIASITGVGGPARVFVDAAGYRMRRERDLADAARSAARRVKRLGRRVVLEPMDARDRRIIHVALQEEPGIFTYSEGQEPFRRVIVSSTERKSDGEAVQGL